MRTALVYDFDGTLAPGNIQEHSLIPEYLKTTKNAFWNLVAEQKKAQDADQILVYLRLLLVKSAALSMPITREILREYGASSRRVTRR